MILPLSTGAGKDVQWDLVFLRGGDVVKSTDLDVLAEELAEELGESTERTRQLVQAVHDGLARYNALDWFPEETVKSTIRSHLKAFWPRRQELIPS
ncbi:MAG: hypothetical protein IRY98_01030 [Alicyclobacillaceae bacterium]|nr:hypothetical protein [Alicyclobacillaceae bacterium]